MPEEELNKIAEGFKIGQMKMKDGNNAKVMWETQNWDLKNTSEQKVEFPAALLKCTALSREIEFSST